MTAPRLLTKTLLRQYLGALPWREIVARIKNGQIPSPLWGVPIEDKLARWDINSVDRALDESSNMPMSVEADVAMLDRHFGFTGGAKATGTAPGAGRRRKAST